MKSLISFLPYSVIILVGIGLTILSLRFVRPINCQTLCDLPEGSACPIGSCRFGEQRAGLPLPVLVDDLGGSSPTGGWGKLGPEDLPNPMTFMLDVLFYSLLFWPIWYIIRVIRDFETPLDFLAVALPLAVVLAIMLLGFFLYRSTLSR